MTDFENGSIAALRATYPNFPLKGCLFHLSKNIYKQIPRQIQDAGLATRYLNDNAFRTNIKMISAISFVPTAYVVYKLSRNYPTIVVMTSR